MSEREVHVRGGGAQSFLDRLNVNEIKVDPTLWGPRSAEVEEFLRNEYDQAKMPLLAAADVKTREGVWLLGWENDNTRFPPLLTYLFGPEYNEEQMARIRLMKQQPAEDEGRFGFGFHRVRP